MYALTRVLRAILFVFSISWSLALPTFEMETAPSASLDMHGWPAFTARMRAAFPGSQRVDLSVANNTWAALWNLTLDIQAGTSAYFYDKIPEKRVCGAPLNDLLKRGGGKKAYGYYCDGVRMYYHEEIAATQPRPLQRRGDVAHGGVHGGHHRIPAAPQAVLYVGVLAGE